MSTFPMRVGSMCTRQYQSREGQSLNTRLGKKILLKCLFYLGFCHARFELCQNIVKTRVTNTTCFSQLCYLPRIFYCAQIFFYINWLNVLFLKSCTLQCIYFFPGNM